MQETEKKKEILSLHEKLVGVRNEIPALVKRTYSEEVTYDFTKIDDIYRYLKPALTKHKVNFMIESEDTTMRDEHGNPVYVRPINGGLYWLYEADLSIHWYNAEDPSDEMVVKLHAIGTHEMPEKAKGSGWTYCLKYYFNNQNCVDQGGEDPDMRAVLPTSEEIEISSQAEQFTQMADDDENPFLSDDQGYPVRDEEQSEEGKVIVQIPQAKQITDSEKLNDRGKDPLVSRNICPENGVMVELPQGVKAELQEENSEQGMTLEEAYEVVCSCGTYRGDKLGTFAQRGKQGIRELEYLARDYRGRDLRMKEAARIILQAGEAA